MRVNPERLVLAREARGLTQKDLAEELNISQGRISKLEKGLIPMPDGLLEEFSECLSFPAAFFREELNIPSTEISFHRKRVSLPKSVLNKVHAQLSIRKFHLLRLLEEIEFPKDRLHELQLSRNSTPRSIAQAVRKQWEARPGPIEDLVRHIERTGVLVIPCKFEHRYFDAVCSRMEGLPPLIFMNKDMPGERQRFTLAHEFAHLIMHQLPTEEMEKEADEFAAELLMPKDDIMADLRGLNFAKLWQLKPRWRVSMGALVKTAGRLGAITANQEQYLWIQLSKAGYRLQEPLHLKAEAPTYLKQIVQLNLEGRSVDELCSILQIDAEEFRSWYLEDEKPKAKRISLLN